MPHLNLARKSRAAFLQVFVVASVLLCGLTSAVCAQEADDEAVPDGRPVLIPTTAHSSAINSLSFSPDGKYLVSASQDHTAKLWDGRTGALLRTLTDYKAPVLSAAFTKDSTKIFSAGRFGTVQWWDAATGTHLGSSGGQKTLVNAISVLPIGASGGAMVIAASYPDRTIKLWKTATVPGRRKAAKILSGHNKIIHALAFSPDGKWLVSGDHDGVVKIWDTEDGSLQYSTKAHGAAIRSLTFQDETTVISGSDDGEAHRLNAVTGKTIGERFQLNSPSNQKGVLAVAASRAGNLSAAGGYRSLSDRKSYLVLWDTKTEKELRALVGPTAPVTAAAFSPNGLLLASGDQDHTVRLWNTQTGKEIVRAGSGQYVSSVAFSPDGSVLASGCGDTAIRLWDTRTGELRALVRGGHTAGVQSVAFSKDGKYFASGGKDGRICVWDAQTYKIIQTWQSKRDTVNVVVFSPSGSAVVSGHTVEMLYGGIEIRDIKSGRLLKEIEGRETSLPPVTSLVFGSDGMLISGSGRGFTGEVHKWDPETGKRVSFESFSPFAVKALAVSENGKFLVIGSGLIGEEGGRVLSHEDLDALAKTPDGIPQVEPAGEQLTIWNGRTMAQQRALEQRGRDEWTNALVFAKDNQTVFSGGEDGYIRAWDINAEAAPKTFDGEHVAAVNGIALSPDGRLLASAGQDNTIRIWNPQTRKLILSMLVLPAAETQVSNQSAVVSSEWLAATPDGYYEGSADAGRSIQWLVEGRLFSVDAYAEVLHKPGVIQSVLTYKPGGDAHTNLVPVPAPPVHHVLLGQVPPSIIFLTPTNGQSIASDTIKVDGYVTDVSKVAEVYLQLNGRTVAASKPIALEARPIALEARPIALEAKPIALEAKPIALEARPIALDVRPIALPSQHKFSQKFSAEFPLLPGENEITLTALAYSNGNLLGREEIHMTRPAAQAKGKLYVLAVGVSKYQNQKFNLKYARLDAEAFANIWKQRGGGLYSEVNVTVLADEQATADHLRTALFKLQEQAKDRDTVAIFLSGHGVQNGDDFYFATQEIEATVSRVNATSLPWTAIETALAGVRAHRVLMFLDACHSGGALGTMQASNERLAELAAKRAGVMVYASSRSSEFSYELDDLKHGAFTAALIEGLQDGKANLEIDGKRGDSITAEDLLAYLRRRVPQITDNKQTPSCPLLRDFGEAYPLLPAR